MFESNTPTIVPPSQDRFKAHVAYLTDPNPCSVINLYILYDTGETEENSGFWNRWRIGTGFEEIAAATLPGGVF